MIRVYSDGDYVYKLFRKDYKLSHKMPYIKGGMDILDSPMEALISELHIIDEDIKLLNRSLI